MKLTKQATKKISALTNSLLVWSHIALDQGKSTEERMFAMKTFNQYADEMIALGISVNKYQGV